MHRDSRHLGGHNPLTHLARHPGKPRRSAIQDFVLQAESVLGCDIDFRWLKSMWHSANEDPQVAINHVLDTPIDCIPRRSDGLQQRPSEATFDDFVWQADFLLGQEHKLDRTWLQRLWENARQDPQTAINQLLDTPERNILRSGGLAQVAEAENHGTQSGTRDGQPAEDCAGSAGVGSCSWLDLGASRAADIHDGDFEIVPSSLDAPAVDVAEACSWCDLGASEESQDLEFVILPCS